MKDTFYFQHDYNARNDPKLQDVLIEHGVAGIGVFWCVIEQLYEQGGQLSLRSCKSIAFALHIDCKIVESIVNDFDLFQNDGTFFWSNSVNSRLEKRKDISEKRKRAIEKRWKSKEKIQEEYKSITNALQEEYNCNTKKYKGKKRKEKERKESTSLHSVDSIGAKRTAFVPPTLEEVKVYVEEKGYAFFDAERFFDFYESKGWMVGKNKMKDWKAAVRNWHRGNRANQAKQVQARNNNINDEW